MKFFHFILLGIPLLLAGCLPQKEGIHVTDAYMFATPKTFPAAAIFMTLENHTDMNDRMVGFETNRAGRTELHTMALVNDIMRMRQVPHYDIPAGETHTLKPMDDHIMVFDMPSDFVTGETFEGTAIFEKAGEVPVTITVHDRAEMGKHME
jgi:copper(I)-binding protein